MSTSTDSNSAFKTDLFFCEQFYTGRGKFEQKLFLTSTGKQVAFFEGHIITLKYHITIHPEFKRFPIEKYMVDNFIHFKTRSLVVSVSDNKSVTVF